MSDKSEKANGKRETADVERKTELLKEILDLEAKAANLNSEANRLRKLAVKKFCPWSEGQFIKIKRDLQDEIAKIVMIKYQPGDSRTINGEWRIRVESWLKDLSRPAKNRSSWYLMPHTEFEVINTDNQ